MLKLQRGAVFLEALVSIAIFAFAFLALMGMQAASVKQTAQAKYRNDASLLANQIIAQIMVDQNNVAQYGDSVGSAPARETWLDQVQSELPNGTASIAYVDTPANPRLLTVTVGWRGPDEAAGNEHQYVASVNVVPAIN